MYPAIDVSASLCALLFFPAMKSPFCSYFQEEEGEDASELNLSPSLSLSLRIATFIKSVHLRYSCRHITRVIINIRVIAESNY